MKVVFVLLLAVYSIDCRKTLSINKNVNSDFINMEIGGGGGVRPTTVPGRQPSPQPAPNKPQTPDLSKPGPAQQPKSPTPVVTTVKPVPVAVPTVPPQTEVKPTQPKPVQRLPNQMDLKPAQTKPSLSPGATTPGPGSVKQLITYYDSQGKASLIRPYTYSAAVKQG